MIYPLNCEFLIIYFNSIDIANIEKGDYHEKDLERIKADVNNDWLKAFYKHGFSNHDKTVNIIHEVLLWRKEFDANSKKISLIFSYIYIL